MKRLSKFALNNLFEKMDIKNGDIVLLLSNIAKDKLHLSERVFIINTLKDYLGSEGSIIMSLAGGNIDPRFIIDMEELSEFDLTRALMYPYRDDHTFVYASDILAKTLLLDEAVVVSDHYSYPYVGVGSSAKLILDGQSHNFPNGELSPLAKLYQLRAKVLLIDYDIFDFVLNNYVVSSDSNSAVSINGGMVLENDLKVWRQFLEKTVDVKKFEKLSRLNNYKKLFYYDEISDMSVMSLSVRAYVDFCRENI